MYTHKSTIFSPRALSVNSWFKITCAFGSTSTAWGVLSVAHSGQGCVTIPVFHFRQTVFWVHWHTYSSAHMRFLLYLMTITIVGTPVLRIVCDDTHSSRHLVFLIVSEKSHTLQHTSLSCCTRWFRDIKTTEMTRPANFQAHTDEASAQRASVVSGARQAEGL